MLVKPITTTQTSGVAPVAPPESEPKRPQNASENAAPIEDHGAELLQEVLDVAQNHLKVSDVDLAFSVHADTGKIKVSVTDKNTGDLIREIPPEGVLNLMAKIDEMMGILFDEKA
jgi:flagellar protein FlaG